MPESLTNADVARAFEELADLMEIAGEEGFRLVSYRRVARTIDDLPTDIKEIADRGELGKLPGVGKSSVQKIEQLLSTGRLAQRDELARSVPETLLALRAIPNLGPKKIAILWRERSIATLDDLRTALADDGLAGLKGFGPKSVEQLRQGIAFLERSSGRSLLHIAAAVAERVRVFIARLPGVQRVEIAGSLRRGQETIGDVDLLCIADDGTAIIERFVEMPEVTAVLGAGSTKGSVRYAFDEDRTVQVDLRVVPEESFGAAWQYFTGSKEHNVRLRERAVKQGWSLNEYGLTAGETVLASRSEEEIYAKLELPWIPPELREDRGEFQIQTLPELVSLADIRGDLHMHTTASDGKNTIEEMIGAAVERGYAYICITDHSQSSIVANGLSVERLMQHIQDVRSAARSFPAITVWVGAEVDILADGALDYPDDVLAQLDWVVASVHVGMTKDIEVNTQRVLTAMRNPYVNLLGHPSGRLLGRREAMPLDMSAVVRVAAETGTALEINASPNRIDLKDTHARLAQEAGAVLCIDTDAHRTVQFDLMRFGVLAARRAWLTKNDVLNTQSADAIRKFVERKRSGARK